MVAQNLILFGTQGGTILIPNMLLKKMPSKELLDRFVRGFNDHTIHVYFDTIKGEFVDDEYLHPERGEFVEDFANRKKIVKK